MNKRHYRTFRINIEQERKFIKYINQMIERLYMRSALFKRS